MKTTTNKWHSGRRAQFLMIEIVVLATLEETAKVHALIVSGKDNVELRAQSESKSSNCMRGENKQKKGSRHAAIISIIFGCPEEQGA